MDSVTILRTFAGCFNAALVVMMAAALVSTVFFVVFRDMVRSPGR